MLSATQMYGRRLVTKDGKNLGRVMNILVNRETSETLLLIFPRIPPRWMLSQSGRVLGQIVSGIITLLKKVFTTEIAGKVIEEVGSRVGGHLSKKAEKRLEMLGRIFYLIPTSLTNQITSDPIVLNLTLDECKEWNRNLAPSTELESPFFEESFYKGPRKEVKISLGLQPIRSSKVVDAVGVEVEIIDMMIDPILKQASAVIVHDIKGRVGKKSIPMKDLRFEDGIYICSKNLEEYESKPIVVSVET